MFCPNCGTEIPDGSKFCGRCGSRIQDYDSGASGSSHFFPPNQIDPVDDYPVRSPDYDHEPAYDPTPSVPPRHIDVSYNTEQSGYTETYSTPGVNDSERGKGFAVASLVLGIISIVFWFFSVASIIGFILGIIGIICAGSAKKRGYTGGIGTAGLVCSILGTIGCSLIFIACVACVGSMGALGSLGSLDSF